RLVPHDRHIRLALDQLLERAALRLAAHATLQSDEFAGRRHPDAGGPEAWVAPDCGGDPLVDLRIALVGATALAGSGETARGAALGWFVRWASHLWLGEVGGLGGGAARV